jgi:hypothetical protein
MIHIGTMDWASTVSTGSFYCPQCQTEVEYRERVSRPFLTLYFIPAIPIGSLSQYVQCRKCENKFEVDVLGLSAPPPRREPQLSPVSLLQVIAALITEDRKIDHQEIHSAKIAFRNICRMELDERELIDACQRFMAQGVTSVKLIVDFAQVWSEEQKIAVVQALFFVASTHGQLSARRSKTLLACAAIFELPQERYEQAIEQTLAWV